MDGRHVLVVRLDSMGDVLLSGPAIRAVAAGATRVTLLTGPEGADAGRLLPGVDEVLVWSCPWIAAEPPRVDDADIAGLVRQLRDRALDEAVVLTSFHQSALPTALLLRLAGVARITAVSDDYPGSLLDVRVASPAGGPEAERMLAVSRAAGFDLPAGDDERLAVHGLPARPGDLPADPYVVAHPGASAPARAYPASSWPAVVDAVADVGWQVVVTGSAAERGLTAAVTAAAAAPGAVHDRGGAYDVAELASVLRGAAAVIVANTGPAHLAAAVGTPVVSLFAPVVPAARWAPYGVPTVVLGDAAAPCRDSRARRCPVPGHPCLASVSPADIVAALGSLVALPERSMATAVVGTTTGGGP